MRKRRTHGGSTLLEWFERASNSGRWCLTVPARFFPLPCCEDGAHNVARSRNITWSKSRGCWVHMSCNIPIVGLPLKEPSPTSLYPYIMRGSNAWGGV